LIKLLNWLFLQSLYLTHLTHFVIMAIAIPYGILCFSALVATTN